MDIAVAQQCLREHDNAVLATWRRDGRLQMSPVTVGLDAAGRAMCGLLWYDTPDYRRTTHPRAPRLRTRAPTHP